MSQLTTREKQYLALTAFGLNSNEIASELNLKASTVHSYRNIITHKLSCQDVFQAVFIAVAKGQLPNVMDRKKLNIITTKSFQNKTIKKASEGLL